ncbi:MAG: LysM peptidoglycan-binding domain-containing protein [Bacteriovorax sp.]|nr:LysM peptidoglycan-binding domain-containing protein [Bacteriovorax sp.]
MKHKTILKIIFLSLVLSSCGLIERFKTPEQPTDSKAAATGDEVTAAPASTSTPSDSTDDLFSKTMDETSNIQTAKSDAPNNVTTDPELKSLEDEFSSAGPHNSVVKESAIAVTPSTAPEKSNEAPIFVEEALPEIQTEVETPVYSEAGQVKSYRVQKGETLMQIAFKLYGDIGKWKDIKTMNSGKFSKNASLQANTELKYKAPATPFVWNPTGRPYMIKNADTLGTIANSVYGNKKKWKSIWENNRPLIKNPNVIYAGFTLYYTNGGMANFVQPKAAQPTKDIIAKELAKSQAAREGIAEEVLVDEEIKAAPKAQEVVTAKDEEQMDEAIQTLSSTDRKKENLVKQALEKTSRSASSEKELDLINNVTVPADQAEMAPDIDEEVQTL